MSYRNPYTYIEIDAEHTVSIKRNKSYGPVKTTFEFSITGSSVEFESSGRGELEIGVSCYVSDDDPYNYGHTAHGSVPLTVLRIAIEIAERHAEWAQAAEAVREAEQAAKREARNAARRAERSAAKAS